MRAMRRPTARLFMAVWLILCLMVGVAWISSRHTMESWTVRYGRHFGQSVSLILLNVDSRAGSVSLWLEYGMEPGFDYTGWSAWHVAMHLGNSPQKTRIKVGTESTDMIPNTPYSSGRILWITIPYWLLLGVMSLLPLLRLLMWWRRRGRMAGLCPNCGYDLRATPDRCPECGTIVASRRSV